MFAMCRGMITNDMDNVKSRYYVINFTIFSDLSVEVCEKHFIDENTSFNTDLTKVVNTYTYRTTLDKLPSELVLELIREMVPIELSTQPIPRDSALHKLNSDCVSYVIHGYT